MQITIQKIVYPGNSLGKGEDNIVTFVDGALPEEVVEIEVTKKKKTFKEGKIINIIKKSEKRIEPKCSSFGKCGGCSFQHTDYENQLALKQIYINELLQPFIQDIQPIIPSPEIWGYRNKMEFSFANHQEELIIGLHEKGFWNKHFPVPPCYIADPDFIPIVEIILDFARKSKLPIYDKKTHEGFFRHLVLRKAKRTNQILVNLVTNKNPSIQQDFFVPLVEKLKKNVTSLYWTENESLSDAVKIDNLTLRYGTETIQEEMNIKDKVYRFNISPFSFFQTNSLGAEKLYETILETLEPQKNDALLDLYCGTGTIGIVLSPYVKQVFGVEQIESAIENALENKKLNTIKNIDFAVGSVEKWFKHGDIPFFNSLIIDPPRGGISNKVIDFIYKTKPDKIVYVSCNPSTLARDLKIIQEKGEYNIQKVVPVDMFPQTYHVEVVVRLEKR